MVALGEDEYIAAAAREIIINIKFSSSMGDNNGGGGEEEAPERGSSKEEELAVVGAQLTLGWKLYVNTTSVMNDILLYDLIISLRVGGGGGDSKYQSYIPLRSAIFGAAYDIVNSACHNYLLTGLSSSWEVAMVVEVDRILL